MNMTSKTNKKVYCTCCARQAFFGGGDTEYTTELKNSVCDIGGVICGNCAKDLDENGMFPEEYAFLANYYE